MEPTPLQAQQAAIQEVRARYERGELSFEDFKRALDALVLAQDADECQAILQALPPLIPQRHWRRSTACPAPPVPAPQVMRQRKRMVAFMGQVKKCAAPGGSNQHDTVAFMGEVNLDLNLADLPPQAKMQLTVIMGEVTIYVPPSARVTVRSTVLLSEVNALGESTNGVVGFGHEQHDPRAGLPRPISRSRRSFSWGV